jgi:hypothetical protein
MYNQYNKIKIQNLRARLKFELRKHLYVPMYLSLSSIVVYTLVHLRGQLESFGHAFLFEDPHVLGVVSIVTLACFLLFFLCLMKDKECDGVRVKDLYQDISCKGNGMFVSRKIC